MQSVRKGWIFTGNPKWSSRSQEPRGLNRRSTSARLLTSWFRIPRGAWMSVCCECYVLSGRGLCDKADYWSRGVLPIVMCRCVWSRNLVNEEALAHWGSVSSTKISAQVPALKSYFEETNMYWIRIVGTLMQFEISLQILNDTFCSLVGRDSAVGIATR